MVGILFAQQMEVYLHPQAARVIYISAAIVAAAIILAAFIVRGRRG